MKKIFKLKERHTNKKTEFIAGLTTFVAMAYILAVNPSILSSTGMNSNAVFTITAITSMFVCVLSAFISNLPFAFSTGMGLNAYFAYTICQSMGFSWQWACASVFVSGVIYLLLMLTKIRKLAFEAIPKSFNSAITAAIGLYCTFIGLQMANIVTENPTSFVQMFSWTHYTFKTYGITVILAIIGIAMIAFFYSKGIKGAILYGILIVWILGIICQLFGIYIPSQEIAPIEGPDSKTWLMPLDYTPSNGEHIVATWHSLIPDFSAGLFRTLLSSFASMGETFGACFAGLQEVVQSHSIFTFIVCTFCFFLINFFDNYGVITGICTSFGLIDKNGKVPGVTGGLISNAIGTITGGIMGLSPIAVFVESMAGISAGGRTGLTALVVGGFFAISLLFAPFFLAIPQFATAPALVFVGFLMIQSITNIDFKKFINAFPAFLTIIAMPFTCSIADGISWGVFSYIILHLLAGKGIGTKKEDAVHPIMFVIAALFIAKYIFI